MKLTVSQCCFITYTKVLINVLSFIYIKSVVSGQKLSGALTFTILFHEIVLLYSKQSFIAIS